MNQDIIIKPVVEVDKALVKKIQKLRNRGLSYQKIADLFNLWRVETRSGDGLWYGKTIRELNVIDT